VTIRPPTVKLPAGAPHARAARERLAEAGARLLRHALVDEQCYLEAAPGAPAELAADLSLTASRPAAGRGDEERWDLLVVVALGAPDSGPAGKQGVPVAEHCGDCTTARLGDVLASMVERLVPEDQKGWRGRLAFESSPSGAAVFLDGRKEAVGTTPFERRVCPGSHAARLAWHERSGEVAVAVEPGRCEQVVADFTPGATGVPFHRACPAPPPAPAAAAAAATAAPEAASEPRTRDRGRLLRLLGIGGVTLAVPLLVTGIALAAVDGRPTCDPVPPQQECPRLYDKLGAGVTLVVLGAAAGAAGGALLGVGWARRPVGVAPIVRQGGGGLVVGGAF
jgi:hypothetical protein